MKTNHKQQELHNAS